MSDNVLDLNREVSIAVLKAQSYRAVRTPRGQKDPGHFGWDPRANTAQASAQVIHAVERNDDNFGVHLHNRVVDIDVDTDNPFVTLSLDYFLPRTPHVWGRASRPRTHRLYEVADEKGFDPSHFKFLDTIKRMPSISVEMRGGKLESGRYSLLPGSVHPSGEPYTWENPSAARSAPIVVPASDLATAVRFSCFAALVAQAWQEGSRNDVALALSGFLWRAAALLEDFADRAPYVFTRDEARSLFEGVVSITDDEEPHMRMSTFDKTWEKAEKGGAVKGGKTLATLIDPKGADEVLRVLYALLVGSNEMEEMEEFYQRYAVINNSKSIVDLTRPGRDRFVIAMDAFHASNRHNVIRTQEGGRLEMTQLLLTSKRTIRLAGVRIDPAKDRVYEENGETFANAWSGWGIEPHPEPVTDDDVHPFLSYIRVVVADGDNEVADWIFTWVADLFRNPGQKSGTSLVLVGKQGAGKSFLGSNILYPIIGAAHFGNAKAIEELTGKFNADNTGKLLIQCDEVLNSRRIADANKMKANITEPRQRVELKGQDPYWINSIERYLFTSNHEKDAIPLTEGTQERRYTVVKVSDRYADYRGTPSIRYWREMGKWCEDFTNLAKVHRWLLDCAPRNSERIRVIRTDARDEMARRSQNGFDDWLMRLVTYDSPFEGLRPNERESIDAFNLDGKKYTPCPKNWPEYVRYKKLEDAYQAYRRSTGMQAGVQRMNAQNVMREFEDRGFNIGKGKRVWIETEEWQNGELVREKQFVRISPFPSRDAINRYLYETFGLKPEDLEEEVGEVEMPNRVTEGPEF